MKILAVTIGIGFMRIPAGLEAGAWIVRAYRKKKAASGERGTA